MKTISPTEYRNPLFAITKDKKTFYKSEIDSTKDLDEAEIRSFTGWRSLLGVDLDSYHMVPVIVQPRKVYFDEGKSHR